MVINPNMYVTVRAFIGIPTCDSTWQADLVSFQYVSLHRTLPPNLQVLFIKMVMKSISGAGEKQSVMYSVNRATALASFR